MTVQVGYIGNKEMGVSSIVRVFEEAEQNFRIKGENVVRNTNGQAFLALAYLTGDGIHHTYDLIDTDETLKRWQGKRLPGQPKTNLVMSSLTRAWNLDTHSRLPAVTYRKLDNRLFVMGTMGSASEFQERLKIPTKRGDTEDICDWIVEQGLEKLPTILESFVPVPCGMHMVFSLIDQIEAAAEVWLLRSRHHPKWGDEPYLHYQNTTEGLIYCSRTAGISELVQNEKICTLVEESIESLRISLE